MMRLLGWVVVVCLALTTPSVGTRSSQASVRGVASAARTSGGQQGAGARTRRAVSNHGNSPEEVELWVSYHNDLRRQENAANMMKLVSSIILKHYY